MNRIAGCMIGGAIGDALGFPVEFLAVNTIEHKYGIGGIKEYELTDGKAVVSDDTQMELFTAEGIIDCNDKDYLNSIAESYLNWYDTQAIADKKRNNKEKTHELFNAYKDNSYLMSFEDIYELRAPGNTCLRALRSKAKGIESLTSKADNNSKGCGSIMRVASISCYFKDAEKAAEIAADTSKLTHGHILGYASSYMYAHMLSNIIHNNMSLKKAIRSSFDAVINKYGEDYTEVNSMLQLVTKAVLLSKETSKSDYENINKIGQGWVAEETLALSIYFALRYGNDFEKAIVASVNHSGDSDSVGKVTGNLVGAVVGLEAIPDKFIEKLEFKDLIIEMSEKLAEKSKNLGGI